MHHRDFEMVYKVSLVRDRVAVSSKRWRIRAYVDDKIKVDIWLCGERADVVLEVIHLYPNMPGPCRSMLTSLMGGLIKPLDGADVELGVDSEFGS